MQEKPTQAWEKSNPFEVDYSLCKIKMMERTLVLIKPDGVERGLIGNIIGRFEQRGLKIIGMKMKWVDKKFAEKHYTDDIAKRKGKEVRDLLLEYVTAGPVVAMVVEGINAVENVRKIVGETEPKAALPGTIRGDLAHVSYSYADEKKMAVKNLIHASSTTDADNVVALWFGKE